MSGPATALQARMPRLHALPAAALGRLGDLAPAAVRSFLHSKVSASAFSLDFLASGSARFCETPKGLEVQQVQQNLGVPSSCVIIYDDS